MPSGTSLFDFTLFKKNLTRYWPIWASYLVIWLLILPINILYESPHSMGYATTYLVRVLDAADTHMYFALIYAVFTAMAVLSHLYSPKSANFFGMLPVRREGIFLTQYLSGFAFLLLPDLMIAALTALAGIGVSFGLKAVFTWLGISLAQWFFFYTLAIFCGMFTGHILALPFFYTVVNSLVVALSTAVEAIFRHYYVGFVSFSEWFYSVVMLFTPVEPLSNIDWDWVTPSNPGDFVISGWLALGVYCLAALALLAASLLLYRKRRMESAGDVVAVAVMRPIFKYGVAVCAGLAMGFVTYTLMGQSGLMVHIIFWSIVGYFIAQMILDKTFRVFSRWKGAAVMTSILTLIALGIVFDITGFQTRVPDLEDIESITISTFSSTYETSDSASSWDIDITDREDISLFRALHMEAVKQIRPDHAEHPSLVDSSSVVEDADYFEDDDYYEDYNYYNETDILRLRMTYHLKSGTLSRSYYIDIHPSEVNTPGTAANILESIYSDRDIYRKLYHFDEIREALAGGLRLTMAEYSFVDPIGQGSAPEQEYEFFAPDPSGNYSRAELPFTRLSDIMALLDAVEADFESGNLGVRHVGQYPNDGESVVRRLCFRADNFKGWETLGYSTPSSTVLEVKISPNAKNTLRVLMELIPGALEDYTGNAVDDAGYYR